MSDDVSFSLARNVQQLQQKLNQTEKSIDDLASIAERFCIFCFIAIFSIQ